MIATEAWVLHNTHLGGNPPAGLQLETVQFAELEPEEVLVEPIYGCWEGNMGHAVARKPIDIAHSRGEARVVIGNAGVVRVLRSGSAVPHLKEGDVCVLCACMWDQHGFAEKVMGYDAPGTLGLLAKRLKLRASQLVPVPRNSRFSLRQWAAFSVRYMTAWGNWRVALGCWNVVKPAQPNFEPCVWGWGGGTAFAELTLAKLAGFRTAMVSAVPARLRQIAEAGISPIDRAGFRDLYFDEKKMVDPEYRERYKSAEKRFLEAVSVHTDGQGASIFVDQIGSAVLPATLKAVGRPGVITTSGWKSGMNVKLNRAVAAMNWHTHVHTHYARLEDCAPAVAFAEQNGWIPAVEGPVYRWQEIPLLAKDYEAGKASTYFPLYQVNAE